MKKLAYSVIGIGGVLTLLIIAQNILIPFVYGIVLWFLGRYFKKVLYKIPLLQKRVPHWVISTLVFGIIFMGVSLISRLVADNISSLLANGEIYKANLNKVLNQINTTFQIDLGQEISKSLKGFDYTTILGNIADTLSGALGNMVMIILYAVFLFSEEISLSEKIKKLFASEKKYEKVSTILSHINDTTSDYIRLKTYVSLLTGILSYLIATLFPAFFSLVQYGEVKPFIIILIGLGLAEWFIGNVLEPKLMGKSLNLSPLVTILALVVWGQIWGITGMLLSTPITVVMLIIFSQFKSTRSIAILLSENGDIDEVYNS